MLLRRELHRQLTQILKQQKSVIPNLTTTASLAGFSSIIGLSIPRLTGISILQSPRGRSRHIDTIRTSITSFHNLIDEVLAEQNGAPFVQILISEFQQLVHRNPGNADVHSIGLDSGEDNHHNLSQNRLSTDLIGAVQSTKVHIVTAPHNAHQKVPSDRDERRSDGGEEDSEHGELDGVVAEAAGLADGVDEAEEDEFGGGGVDLAAEEAEGEELEGAVEGGLDDLGVGGVDGEEERGEDGLGVGEDEADDGGVGVVERGVGEGVEFVEGGFGGGDQMRVLPPRRVLDDFVEGRAEDAAGA